jgi:hypothetical protein
MSALIRRIPNAAPKRLIHFMDFTMISADIAEL